MIMLATQPMKLDATQQSGFYACIYMGKPVSELTTLFDSCGGCAAG